MSTDAINNKIIPQTTQVPAGGAQSAPAAQQTPVEEPLFGGSETATTTTDTVATTGGDTFTPSTGTSSAELSAQKAAVEGNNDQLKESEASTQTAIENCEARIENQENLITSLNETNETLKAENKQLNEQIRTANGRISQINGRINELNNLIKENSGFVGGLINGVKGIFGNGVDVNALRSELAALEAEKKELQEANNERRQQITENGGTIDENNERIDRVTEFKEDNEQIKANQEAALKEIQEQYQQGLITKEQLEQAIEAAYAAEAAEKAEAEKQAQNEAATTETAAPAETTTEEPSQEQIDGATAVLGDILTNGEVSVDTMEAVGDGIAAQDPTTGEFNAEVFQPAYEESGFAPEEAAKRLDAIEALVTYEDLGFGLGLDVETFQELTADKLDEVIETAIVQDVIKTTSTKVIGKGAIITSKKDMQKNSKAVDNFISTYSALNSYYQANDVENLEVSSFLKLSGEKLNGISNGYTIGTDELNEMTNNAGAMMTTLRTAVSLDEAVGKSANIQFQENKHKTEDAINNAEHKLGENNDESTVDEFRTEFLNLTSKFNNSDADSAKQVSIKAMEALYQRALRADDGVNKDPYRKDINVAA